MPGVSALEHRADTCAFVGVITASGDALRLVPPVRASPGAPADAWLRALLAGSRAALHRAVDQARKGKARAPRREWVLAHGAQPLGVALAMHFALAVEAALEGGPGAAPAALAALAAALEAEAAETLGLLCAADPGPRARAAVPPPSRTKWTRLVHPSVLTGHVSSLSHRRWLSLAWTSRSATRWQRSPPPRRRPRATLRGRRGCGCTGRRSRGARTARWASGSSCPPRPPLVLSGHAASLTPY